MEQLEVQIKIRETVNVTVDYDNLIEGLNSLSMAGRWNFVAIIFNELKLSLSELTESEKEVVKKYMADKIKLLKNTLNLPA